jgi:hypothetical protein
VARLPESKAKRIVFVPVSLEDEKMAVDFKTLCQQDGVTIHDLMSEALSLVFKVHHWPPGNPQLTLSNYQVKLSASMKCGFSGCKGEAVGSGVFLPKNKEYQLCPLHFAAAKNSSKVWRLS